MVCYVVCDFRQVLAFLHLARWLQLYVVGDAKNAEVELAEELAGVDSAAFGKGGPFCRCAGTKKGGILGGG